MSYSLTECVPSETASTTSVIIRLRSGETTAGRHEKDMTLTDGETSYPGFSGVVSGYRLYSPMLERWLSRDPIGEEGGINIYTWCLNSPSLYFDSHGKSAVQVIIIVGVIIFIQHVGCEMMENKTAEETIKVAAKIAVRTDISDNNKKKGKVTLSLKAESDTKCCKDKDMGNLQIYYWYDKDKNIVLNYRGKDGLISWTIDGSDLWDSSWGTP